MGRHHGYGSYNKMGVRQRRQLRKYGAVGGYGASNNMGVRERRQLRKYGGGLTGSPSTMSAAPVVPLLGLGLLGGALWTLKKRKTFLTSTSTIAQPAILPETIATTGIATGMAAPASVVPPLKHKAYFDETGFVSKPVNRKYVFRPTLWTKAKSLINPLNKW